MPSIFFFSPARRPLWLSALALLACKAPTQARLELTTDIDCRDGPNTSITVGLLSELETRPPSTVTTKCDPETGRIGSIILAPSGSSNADFAVRVVTGLAKTADECVAHGYVGGCIVARRSLHYLPSETLELPVRMEAACLDVPCGATQTCRAGRCVSAELDPEDCLDENGCDVEDGGTSFGGMGGGSNSSGGNSSGGAPSRGGSGGSTGGNSSGGNASGGSDSGCASQPEQCNGLDDNCDGRIDYVDSPSELCDPSEICVDGVCESLGVPACRGFHLGDHAYALCDGPLSWPDARMSCNGLDGELVDIDSRSEARGLRQAVASSSDVWTNYIRYYPTCVFTWDDDAHPRFEDWAPGKPDGACFYERCVTLSAPLGHRWDDTDCDLQTPYLCEWSSVTSTPPPQCDLGIAPELRHSDGDGFADYDDTDDDDDGISDVEECFPGQGLTTLSDGSFDAPPIEDDEIVDEWMSGWSSDNGFVRLREDGYEGQFAHSRLQYGSLSHSGQRTYFQDVVTLPGTTMRWALRARAETSPEIIEILIGAPDGTPAVSPRVTQPSEGWKLHTGTYVVPAGQTTTRFALRAFFADTTSDHFVDTVGFEPVCVVDSDHDGCVDSTDPD